MWIQCVLGAPDRLLKIARQRRGVEPLRGQQEQRTVAQGRCGHRAIHATVTEQRGLLSAEHFSVDDTPIQQDAHFG
jgi:hypothetical protein